MPRMKFLAIVTMAIALGLAADRAGGVEPATKRLPGLQRLSARIDAADTVPVLGTVYVKSTSGTSMPCDWQIVFDRQGRYRQTLAICGCDDVKAYRYTVCDGSRFMTVDDGQRR